MAIFVTSIVTIVVANQPPGSATPAARQPASASATAKQRGECRWEFARYEPSTWEQEWFKGETSGERQDKECELLASPTEVDRSVRLIRAVQGAVLRNEPIPTDAIGLFSRMVYAERCGGEAQASGRTRVQLIEPLVGILRDPLTICPRAPGVPDDIFDAFAKGEDKIQAKRHLLIGPAAPWSDSPQDPAAWQVGGFGPWSRNDASPSPSPRCRMNLVMDIGASVYGGWQGDAGAVGAWWIVERSRRHNVDYDWIVSFEYEKIDPTVVFAGVPNDLLPHYIYFNQGVEKAAGGRWNPWRILQGMHVTPDDYVVVKLDIDNPEIENELVDQVMTTPVLQGLIDEMFYEHHVDTKVMRPYWGTGNSKIYLKDSYRNFNLLRSEGIRMHSWP